MYLSIPVVDFGQNLCTTFDIIMSTKPVYLNSFGEGGAAARKSALGCAAEVKKRLGNRNYGAKNSGVFPLL
jgi:hypothetical protein